MQVAAAANLLPVALILWFVQRFGFDLPWWDEWGYAYLLRSCTLSSLFAQNNEHRPFFPRLLTLVNAALFHWNRKAEMYMTAALLILCAWLLFRLMRAYWAHPLTLLLFLPIVWTVLSWRQWFNLLFGFQTCFGLLAAGTVLAFCMLHRARKIDRFVLTAAVGAFVASFSLGAGLLIWPVGLAQLLLQRWCGRPGERPGLGAFAFWTAAGTLTWAGYFFGYHQPPLAWANGPEFVIHHPVLAVQYMATLIGGPLSFHQPTAQSFGVIVTVLGAWAVFRLRKRAEDLAAAAPLLALLAFTLVDTAANCDQRMGGGLPPALYSRYCSVTDLGLVALYALLVKFALTERRPAHFLACGGMAAFLVLAAMTNFVSWRDDPAAQERLDSYALGAYALRHSDVVSDEAIISGVCPMPDPVRELAPFLRDHGYTLFHRVVQPDLPARYNGGVGGCNIEVVNGKPGWDFEVHRRDENSGLRVVGWAVDLRAGQEASRIFVNFDNRIDVPALYGQPRPDVALALRNPNYAAAGYVSYVRTSLLTVGAHFVQLKIVSHDGSSYSTCSAARLRVVE